MIQSVEDISAEIYKHTNKTKMNIQQIAKKYSISDAFLNSKDDAFPIIAQSIVDLKSEIQRTSPNKKIEEKLDKLIEFCVDVKRSTI